MNRFYTKRSLYQLFLVCVFPLHIWTMMMVLRDYGWVAERTNHWDAVSYISYTLIYTLIETIAVFLVILLLGLLVLKSWGPDRRVGIAVSIFLIVSSWVILGQWFSFSSGALPAWLFDFLVHSGHALRWIWGLTFLPVFLSVVIPIFGILHSQKWNQAVISFFERIMTLSVLYLFLDGMALLVIVARGLLA